MLEVHLSKGVEKNILKTWNFTGYKFCQILDSCFNDRLMSRQLTDLTFKMIPSLLAVRKMSLIHSNAGS